MDLQQTASFSCICLPSLFDLQTPARLPISIVVMQERSATMPLQKPRPTEKVSFSDENVSASTPPRVRTIRRADTLHIAPSSSFYESAGRNRSRILLVFAFVAIIALLIGIAFTSRHYYVVWGGQNAFEGISQFKASTLGLDNGSELKARSNDVSLGKRSSVSACAAGESDCSAFDKPVSVY